MSRDPQRKLLNSPKDEQGRYLPTIPPKHPKGTLDDILQRQLAGLELLTESLVKSIAEGDIGRETAQQLATVVKITMELKAKENELLENLTDEELAKIAAKNDN